MVLPKLINEGKEFPFIVVSPQCPDNVFWNTDVLSALIDEIESNYRVDKNRIYVTGLSMGGNGTWTLALAEPQIDLLPLHLFVDGVILLNFVK